MLPCGLPGSPCYHAAPRSLCRNSSVSTGSQPATVRIISHQHPGRAAQAEHMRARGHAVILDPDTYVCPEHQADLTAQVREALEDDGPPLAYQRPTLLGRAERGRGRSG